MNINLNLTELRIEEKKMAKYSVVEGQLKQLTNKTLTIQELVDLILSIDNIKSKHDIALAQQKSPYDDLDDVTRKALKPLMKDVSSMKVDFSYQRYLNLKYLLKRLVDSGGNFIPSRASVINVRIRTNGDHIIWDGLRRAVLCGLKGIWKIPVLAIPHSESLSPSKQVVLEAQDFSSFNGRGSEKMKKEEVWKADYIAQEPEAVTLGRVLNDCNLDVLNVLQNGGLSLGGFAVFQRAVSEGGINSIAHKYLERASIIIQKSYVKESSMKGYLLTGIAKYLQLIDSLAKECEDDCELPCDVLESTVFGMDDYTLIERTKLYAEKPKTQWQLVTPSWSNRQVESAAYNFFMKVVRHQFDVEDKKTIEKIMLERLGIDPDDD